MAVSEWYKLWERVQRRAIRVIDITTILICDGLVNGVGYWLVRSVATHFANSGSRFLDTANKLSEAVFLLLYVAFVVVDVREYIMTEVK